MEKIIHQIWLGDKGLPEREKNFVNKMKSVNHSFEHRLWYDGNLPQLEGEISEVYQHFRDTESWAFAADVMRIWLVYQYGGLYVDVDFEPLKSIDDWELQEKNGFFYHGDASDFTLTNGLFGLTKGHPLAKHIVDSIRVDNLFGYFPSWFGLVVKKYYSLEYDTPLDILKQHFLNDNIYCPYVRDAEQYLLHHGLYSWSESNKSLFHKRLESNPFI